MNRQTETETDFSTGEIATETETDKARRIPIHGSFTRPGTPEEGLAEMIAGRQEWTQGSIKVTISTEEFTSVCPTTGLPDFNAVVIEYIPNRFYLESKTVKYYFYAFREYGAHCEKLAQRILEDVRLAIDPAQVRVVVNQSPRGGLRIVGEAFWSQPSAFSLSLKHNVKSQQLRRGEAETPVSEAVN